MFRKLVSLILAGFISVASFYVAHADYSKVDIKSEYAIVSVIDRPTVVIRVGEYPGKAGKRTTVSDNIKSRLSNKYPLNNDNTLSEYYINKGIAEAIQRHLEGQNVNVILQDTYSKSEDLNNAGRIAVEHNADVYLSVHTNASDNTDVNGFYMITGTNDYIQNKKVEDTSNYIAARNSIKKRSNAYNEKYIGELNEVVKSGAIAVVCEYGFYTNENDLLLMTDNNYIDQIGKITADAISKHMINK